MRRPDVPPEAWGADWHPPRWVTLWLPVVISFLVQVPSTIWRFRTLGTPSEPRALGLELVIAVIGPLALIGARRFPGPVVAIVSLAAAADLFASSSPGPPYIALAFAVIGAVVRGARIWAWVSLAVCWVATIALSFVIGRDDWHPLQIAGTTLGILFTLGIGEAIRGRRDRMHEFRELAAQRRQREMQAERMRIARELHDVLAHSLSQINVQAGVGLHLLDRRPDQAREALASIKESSKSALDEVRSVLGMLRSNGADGDAPLVPEPDLARLPDLVAATARDDLRVELDDRIESAPKHVQLAAYRIVQESLTNVTRHSDARAVTVRLWSDDRDYRLEVRDDGSGSPGTASESGGRGLLGMRERAELLGGHLTAGPADGGGFLVSATVPIDRGASS